MIEEMPDDWYRMTPAAMLVTWRKMTDAAKAQVHAMSVLARPARPTLAYDKVSITAFVPAERPTLYRVYRGDTLVYLGASMAPRARLLTHLRDGIVAGDRVSLEFYRTTTAMAKAEKLAIVTEKAEIDPGPSRRHWSWKARR